MHLYNCPGFWLVYLFPFCSKKFARALMKLFSFFFFSFVAYVWVKCKHIRGTGMYASFFQNRLKEDFSEQKKKKKCWQLRMFTLFKKGKSNKHKKARSTDPYFIWKKKEMKIWYIKFTNILPKRGFTRSTSHEICLFYYNVERW